MAIQPISTIKIFYCYAHEDDALREQLAMHLSPLERLRQITGWYNRDIQAGTDWNQEIETQLDSASIILLLISPAFFASDDCYTVEMQRALKKHRDGTARVIPIILRPVEWKETPIGKLLALPTGNRPITLWSNQDEAWLNVVQSICEAVRDLLPDLSQEDTDILRSVQAPDPKIKPRLSPAWLALLLLGVLLLLAGVSIGFFQLVKKTNVPTTVVSHTAPVLTTAAVVSHTAPVLTTATTVSHTAPVLTTATTVRPTATTPTTTEMKWTKQSSGVSKNLTEVIQAGTQFVAVGWSGVILTSPNGKTWTSQTSSVSDDFGGVSWSGKVFVAVGNNGTILTSPDGKTWTKQDSGTTNYITGVAWSGKIFMAVGNNGTILTSPDGMKWTPVQDPNITTGLNAVFWLNSQFVAVGNGGTILTSPDGMTWTPKISGTGENLWGAFWLNSQFVAVGEGGTILTSPDGVTWTLQTSGVGGDVWLTGVTSSSTQFVVVGQQGIGQQGIILTSPDGVKWTPQTSGTQVALYGVSRLSTPYDVSGSSKPLVAVGLNGTILTSP